MGTSNEPLISDDARLKINGRRPTRAYGRTSAAKGIDGVPSRTAWILEHIDPCCPNIIRSNSRRNCDGIVTSGKASVRTHAFGEMHTPTLPRRWAYPRTVICRSCSTTGCAVMYFIAHGGVARSRACGCTVVGVLHARTYYIYKS
ncbi:hypothetical protein PLICRDRAFT_508753 [Plicaturopsis crispa FD-325 SS-3]|nr:hypothetical protein PLICRDRAFT_508753 [Plicaturopsis crispa FD-325 SS-3]